MGEVQEKKLHIAMYPWFAMGHMTPFLHLANKLAQRGHKVSLFLPPKVHLKLAHLNCHPELISFTTVPVPAVDGLSVGANTTADIPRSAGFLLFDLYDLTQPTIDVFLAQLKPDIVFYDYAYWLPGLARKHRAQSVFFSTTYVSFYAYMVRWLQPATEAELKQPPLGFPSQFFCYRAHEARMMGQLGERILRVSNMTSPERVYKCIDESDAVCCKSCKEMEGPFGDYFEKHYRKPVLWAGPILPELPASGWLDEKLDGWLKKFEEGNVVYCALGSESVLPKEQFQELVLGLELAGFPFIAVLKSPTDCETIESAVPEGFLERVKERGIVQNTWVQQHLILKHPSVGCFVTHCGAGSLSEALVSECQLVLVPQFGDQFLNARLMSEELRVGVEVEKGEEDGLFTKEGVCNAVVTVVDRESEVGKEVRTNHAKWRAILLNKELQDAYIDDLIHNLQDLVQLS